MIFKVRSDEGRLLSGYRNQQQFVLDRTSFFPTKTFVRCLADNQRSQQHQFSRSSLRGDGNFVFYQLVFVPCEDEDYDVEKRQENKNE